jgi:acyl carrier protein
MDNTFDRLKAILERIKPDSDYSNITEDSDIKNDLNLNSIGFLYLVLGVEEEFGVEIHNVNAEEFKTVKDVINYLDNNK